MWFSKMRIAELVKYSIILLMIQGATSCTSATEERGAKAVADLYGGEVIISKGANAATEVDEFQGEYLKIKLANPSLAESFHDLRIPASFSAAMVYGALTPVEQKKYAYIVVGIENGSDFHEFKFKSPILISINNALADVNALLINLQTEDSVKVFEAFNPSVVSSDKQADLPVMLGKITRKLNPISNYMVVGSEVGEIKIAKQKIKLVRLFVRVEHTGKWTQMVLAVNPAMHPDQQFLYGLQLL
jgi:hypothetical protein